MISEVINLSQPSVFLDPDCPVSSAVSSDSQAKLTNSLDLMTVSESQSKIRSFPLVTCVPTLPIRSRQLNNDLELRTLKITPIISQTGI